MRSEAQPIEVEVLPPAPERNAELMRLIALVMDDLIPVPGTQLRIGLDPIIGLFPGLGDGAASLVSLLAIVQALRAGVPRIVIARMAGNVFVNALGGALPGVGDLFSAWFKSNRRNYELLRRHSGRRRRATAGDWLFVGGLVAALAAVIVGIGVLVIAAAAQVAALLTAGIRGY